MSIYSRAQSVDQDVYETSTTRKARLGQVIEDENGNKYIYAKASEALSQGMILVATTAADDTVSSNTAKTIIETVTGLTADENVGGYVIIDDGTGEGQVRKCIANTTTTITLDRALDTALDVADSDVTILRPHIVEKAAVTTEDQPVVGVAPEDVASGSYFWMQVSGTAGVLTGAAAAAAVQLSPGDDTEGTAKTIGAGVTSEDTNVIGHVEVASPAADTMALVHLTIQ